MLTTVPEAQDNSTCSINGQNQLPVKNSCANVIGTKLQMNFMLTTITASVGNYMLNIIPHCLCRTLLLEFSDRSLSPC